MYIFVIINKFIFDLCEVVKVGDIVKVKVFEVDVVCKCISFIMCLDDDVDISNKVVLVSKFKLVVKVKSVVFK